MYIVEVEVGLLTMYIVEVEVGLLTMYIVEVEVELLTMYIVEVEVGLLTRYIVEVELLTMYILYFLEISPHLELSPPSKSRRVVLTLNALNAALEFSPHVVKGRHYYSAHKYDILTLILNNAQCARSPIVLLVR